MARDMHLMLAALGLGAVAMYLTDPQSGRRRRARLQEQYARAVRKVRHGAARRGIVVEKSVHVAASVDDVFRHWTIENFPQWMSHVKEVTPLGGNRHHWVVEGPAGVPVEWNSEITSAVDDTAIEWRSEAGSMIDNAGRVHFAPEGDGTRVQVTLCYMPPAGALGHVVAKALGADPESRMDDDLMRFKALIETGRPAQDAAARQGTPGVFPPSESRH